MTKNKRLEWLLSLPMQERRAALRNLTEAERQELAWHWRLWARNEQLAPASDWRLWLIMAGRGFGKTRAGAEWVREIASTQPNAQIALVAASLGEARAVMIEGDSGLLSICPPRRRPKFEPSLKKLTWPNGAQATLYSAGEPESLRGPQHSHAFRPGPERSVRKRSARTDRCAAALRNRRQILSPPPASPADGLNWLVGSAPTEPVGGANADAKARTAISELIAALREAGVFPTA